MAHVDDDARLSRERDFHNDRFGASEARREDAFYFAIADGAEEYGRRVRAAARGRDVLEYGCAGGGASVALAASARSLVGIDISDVAIAQAVAAASAAGLAQARFQVGDAERMDLPSDAFDLVFGSGIVHHLDVEAAIGEVRRVLRPGGRAIFWEPLGHNALINLYRARTPHARTPDEHPLLRRDVDLMAQRFAACDLSFHGLATLASIPLRGGPAGRAVRAAGGWADALLLRVPGLRWQAWYVLMDLRA